MPVTKPNHTMRLPNRLPLKMVIRIIIINGTCVAENNPNHGDRVLNIAVNSCGGNNCG
jgi:hypothetical protein